MQKIVYRCDICGKEIENLWRAHLREYKFIKYGDPELVYNNKKLATTTEGIVDICGECYDKLFKEGKENGNLQKR